MPQRVHSAIIALCYAAALGAYADPPTGARWTPIPELTDEFDGAELDREKWHDHNPGWTGRKPGFFSPGNVRVRDGYLELTARLEEPPPNLKSNGYHTFSTAAVKSRTTARYGFYEIRARAMNSKASSAFWFYRADAERYTEIDVFEICGGKGRAERKVYSTLHVLRSPETGNRHTKTGQVFVADTRLADRFFTYGLEWDAEQIAVYVDGARVASFSNTHWHQDLHLNFDSETMPEWFGLPDPADLPSVFSIDYVRAWREVTDAPPP